MSHITRAPVAAPHTASPTRPAPSAPGKHAPVLIAERPTQGRPHCPHREPAYFEAARMSREMERL